MRRLAETIMVLAMLPVLAACCGCQPKLPSHRELNFYLSSLRDLQSISRVAFVELPQDTQYPDVAADTTNALQIAITERRLFTAVVVWQSDPLYQVMPKDSTRSLTLPQIAKLRQDLECDAILFGTVVHYRPYPHMLLSLQLKLVDLRSGKLVWAIEQVWDTSDDVVEDRLRHFFREEMRPDYEPLGWRLALASPRAFEKFVAWETASTFVPRVEKDKEKGEKPYRP